MASYNHWEHHPVDGSKLASLSHQELKDLLKSRVKYLIGERPGGRQNTATYTASVAPIVETLNALLNIDQYGERIKTIKIVGLDKEIACKGGY